MVNSIDNIKREAMIEMLQALDAAFGIRVAQWQAEASNIPRVVLSPHEGNKNKARVLECKIRIDEIQEIRKLVTGTIATCEEQNAKPVDDVIAVCPDEQDAQRIVDCVRACRRLDTKTLEIIDSLHDSSECRICGKSGGDCAAHVDCLRLCGLDSGPS